MASEQRTEPAENGPETRSSDLDSDRPYVTVRLRQDPPVIADRVKDCRKAALT